MQGIQLVAAVFALGMGYATYADFRRRRYGSSAFIFWELIWVGLLAVSVFPRVFRSLSLPFGARLMDIVIVLGMLVFGAVIYRMFVQVSSVERQLEQLVRSQALAHLGTVSTSEPQEPSPK